MMLSQNIQQQLKTMLIIITFLCAPLGLAHSKEIEYFQAYCEDKTYFNIELKRKVSSPTLNYKDLVIGYDDAHDVTTYSIINTPIEPVLGACKLLHGTISFEVKVVDLPDHIAFPPFYTKRKKAEVKLWMNYFIDDRYKTLVFHGIMGDDSGTIISRLSSIEGFSLSIEGINPEDRNAHMTFEGSHFSILDIDLYKINIKQFLKLRSLLFPLTKLEGGEMKAASDLGKQMFEYYNKRTQGDVDDALKYPRYGVDDWH